MPLKDETDADGVRRSPGNRWYLQLWIIQLTAVCVSVGMTLVAVSQDITLNSDGVLYLLAAEAMANGDFGIALQLHGQPLYSLLIFATEALLGIGMEPSAHVVNGFLQALLVFAFIAAVTEIELTTEHAWLAAVVILSFTNLNEYRSEIIRGFGFWSFLMLGFWWFLRYSRTRSFAVLIASLAALFLATLFRIEGLALMMAMPLAFLLMSDSDLGSRLKPLLTVYGLYLVVGTLAVAALAVQREHLALSSMIDIPMAHASHLISSLGSHIAVQVEVVSTHLLNRYSYELAPAVVAMTMLLVLLTESLSSLGLVYAVSVAGAVKLGWSDLSPAGVRVWVTALFAYIAVLALFVVARGFLTGRYSIGFALLALVLAPIGLRSIYRAVVQRFPGRRQVVVFTFSLALVVTYMFLDGVVSTSQGKVHEQQAAAWLRESLDRTADVLSFENDMLYRSGRLTPQNYLENLGKQRNTTRDGRSVLKSWREVLIERGWADYDYFVVSLGRKKLHEQAEIEAVIGNAPLKVFEGPRKGRVLVYSVNQ